MSAVNMEYAEHVRSLWMVGQYGPVWPLVYRPTKLKITTVEGLSEPDGELHPLQEAFWEKHGLQCGFCTPGMLMSACHFLEENPNPTREQIREGISGNLCRCTGYQNIVDAVELAAEMMNKNKKSVEEPSDKKILHSRGKVEV